MPSTWRSREIGRPAVRRSRRVNASNLNRVTPRNGLKGCKATRGVGSWNTRAADLTHGQSWLTATQLDDGGIELARKSSSRFGKWPRRILVISKPSGSSLRIPDHPGSIYATALDLHMSAARVFRAGGRRGSSSPKTAVTREIGQPDGSAKGICALFRRGYRPITGGQIGQ